MSELAALPKRRIGLLIWLIVSQLLALGSLLIWVIVAGFSGMVFDAEVSLGGWAFLLAVWAYPLFLLVMGIGAWVAFAFRKDRLVAVLTGLTFAPMVVFCLYLGITALIGT